MAFKSREKQNLHVEHLTVIFDNLLIFLSNNIDELVKGLILLNVAHKRLFTKPSTLNQ